MSSNSNKPNFDTPAAKQSKVETKKTLNSSVSSEDRAELEALIKSKIEITESLESLNTQIHDYTDENFGVNEELHENLAAIYRELKETLSKSNNEKEERSSSPNKSSSTNELTKEQKLLKGIDTHLKRYKKDI